MNILKKMKKTSVKQEGTYRAAELTIRQDSETGELCLYTYEIKKTENEVEILCKETNVKNPENVIRWIGHLLPARPKWARNYINKADYERYGAIYSRIDVFSKYLNDEYDENKSYTKEQLVKMIDGINQKRNREKSSFEKNNDGRGFGE